MWANFLFLLVDNGPEITEAIKSVLKDDYNYDSTVRPQSVLQPYYIHCNHFDSKFPQPTFYALYRSFTQCQFIEDKGDVIFYKNRDGKAMRDVDPSVVKEMKAKAETQDDVELEDFELEGSCC